MRDIQKQIEEALKDIPSENAKTRNKAIGVISTYAVTWLTHQQSIISQLREEIITQRNMFHENAYKLAKVSEDAYIRELQDTVSQQTAEIERLTQALITERNDAITWDGIGTINRINKVLEGSKPNVNP